MILMVLLKKKKRKAEVNILELLSFYIHKLVTFVYSNFSELFLISSFQRSSPYTLRRISLKQSSYVQPQSPFQTTRCDITVMSLISSMAAFTLMTMKSIPARTLQHSDSSVLHPPLCYVEQQHRCVKPGPVAHQKVQTGTRSTWYLYCSLQVAVLSQQVMGHWRHC